MHCVQLAVSQHPSTRELLDHHAVTKGYDNLLWLRNCPLPKFPDALLCVRKAVNSSINITGSGCNVCALLLETLKKALYG